MPTTSRSRPRRAWIRKRSPATVKGLYLYTPSQGIRLLINWEFDPVSYEIARVDVPEGFTLVIGADLPTMIQIHDYRAYYDRSSRPDTISAGTYDDEHPYTGFGPVISRCILVRTDSLDQPTDR
jgi:hypothetical protein